MSKGAAKELKRQQGVASVEDLELSSEGVDVSKFLCDVAGRHGLKFDFAGCITEGYVERTIEGANLISITVHDGSREILRSGMFGTKDNTKLPAIDVKVDGLWYRLAGVQKEGYEIILEFEDRIIFYLKQHNKPLSASRAHMTRAEFIRKMVMEVKAEKIRFFCPELHKKQPIEGIKPEKKTERERRAELAGGLLSTTDIKIKGEPANKNQLEILEEILDTGTQMGADKKVLLSAIMCVIQESDVHNDKGEGGVNVGPFNQNVHDGWPASGNVVKDAEAYYKQAIANDKAKPDYTLTELVQSVQKSGFPNAYAQWRQEAETILKEYGEKGIGAKHSQTRVKEYDFHRGRPDGKPKENTWEASERLAQEVNWRRFVVGLTFYYVQDSDLISRKPVAEFSEDDDGIEEINGVIAAGIPTSECVVHCRATRWWAPPGSVVKVKDTGPFNGRWLVFGIKRDLFSVECEVKLHQPEAAKPEPAPETESVETSGAGEGLVLGGHIGFPGATARQLIVEAAKWGLAHKQDFQYQEIRPMPKSLFSKPPLITDCSGFATLCYKAANVKDPNGLKYNGTGFTGTLRAHGKKTNTAEPGDLVFYKSPEHVAVYIGEGKVIEFGGPGGPHEEPIHYRNDLLEIRTYELDEEPGLTPKPARHNEPPTPVQRRGPTPENDIKLTPEEQNVLGAL